MGRDVPCRRDGSSGSVSLQYRGANVLIAHVIARSGTTKRSPYSKCRRLLRCARNDILYQCAFKQVIKTTAGQAGSGAQETDLTLLIAHWY